VKRSRRTAEGSVRDTLRDPILSHHSPGFGGRNLNRAAITGPLGEKVRFNSA